MRLGYSRFKNSIFYYAQKTVYVDGKNKSMIVKKGTLMRHALKKSRSNFFVEI